MTAIFVTCPHCQQRTPARYRHNAALCCFESFCVYCRGTLGAIPAEMSYMLAGLPPEAFDPQAPIEPEGSGT